jgi:hypothetical protein
MLRNNLLHEMPRQQVFSEAHGVPDYDGRRTVRPRAASPQPGSKFPCTITALSLVNTRGKFGAVTNRQPKTIFQRVTKCPGQEHRGLFARSFAHASLGGDLVAW